MGLCDKLQRIPMFDYPNCAYEDAKQLYYKSFNQFLKEGCSVAQAVAGTYYHGIDHVMNENGMGKFVAMLTGMLFMIEQGDVEPDQAYGTNYDICDFETGAYDDLFTPSDLELIKKDIKIIKDYLMKHPELIKE